MLLEEEGFAWENYVDIFDGGPTMTARTDQIRSIREAKDSVIVEVSDALGEHIGGEKMLVSSGRMEGFKTAYGWVEMRDGGVAIDPRSSRALGVDIGDSITHVARW